MPKWRPFTWVILAVNVLFLIWLITGISTASGNATNCGTLSQETCNEARNAGTAIGAGIIIFLWALVDVILGVIWLITRPKRRECPACGTEVKRGVTRCPSCGYDFAAVARSQAPPPPPMPTSG
jgi:zinc-ribbon domain